MPDDAKRPERSPSARRGTVRAIGAAVDRTTRLVRDVHRAIAKQPYEVLEHTPVAGAAALLRPIHEGITEGVYAAVRAVSGVAFATAELAVARSGASKVDGAADSGAGDGDGEERAEAPEGAASGSGAIGILNAVAGDHLARAGNPLAIPLSLRAAGRDVAPTPDGLRAALADGAPTDRVVVFLHGLALDERCWSAYAARNWGDPGVSYGGLLRARHGWTPLYVRYNTGLDVRANGRALAALLGEIARAYRAAAGTPLRDLAIVGHSMGGLVARHALDVGVGLGHGGGDDGGGGDDRGAAAWTALVRSVVCLGSPHLGAPLEKLGVVAAQVLGAFDVTAPFGRYLDERSAGVKDLGAGLPAAAAPAPDGTRFYFVASSLADGPVGWALGDGMVRVGSALPRDIAHDDRAVVIAAHHGELVNHPDVFAHVERWLAR